MLWPGHFRPGCLLANMVIILSIMISCRSWGLMTPCLRCLLGRLGMTLVKIGLPIDFLRSSFGMLLGSLLKNLILNQLMILSGGLYLVILFSPLIYEAGVLIVATIVLCDRLKESLYSLLLWELLSKQFMLIYPFRL